MVLSSTPRELDGHAAEHTHSVYMDDLVFLDGSVEYWTFTGTPSQTGKWVRVSGAETWTIGEDGVIAASKGTYDQTEHERQLEYGAPT